MILIAFFCCMHMLNKPCIYYIDVKVMNSVSRKSLDWHPYKAAGNRWTTLYQCCPDNKWLLTDHKQPFSPLPPPTLRDSSSFSYIVPYHLSVCRFAHGHTGVFYNTSFDINYWHNLFFLKYSPVCTPFGMTFRTFTQHFFADKCTPPLLDNNFKNSFFPLFTIAFTL